MPSGTAWGKKASAAGRCIHGCAGVGKTILIKNLLSGIEIPIIYWGMEPEKEYICCKTSAEFLEEIKKHESCVAFVDNVLILAKEPRGFGDLNKEDENLTSPLKD